MEIPRDKMAADAVAYGGRLVTSLRGEVVRMVTYSELFQFCLVVIGIVALVFQGKQK